MCSSAPTAATTCKASPANCPECGIAVDREALARSQIPWSHRKQIGWWRAYWRTVKLVVFKSKILASEVARPVSYRDAQLFRAITIALAIVPAVIVVGVWWMTARDWERSNLAGDVVPFSWYPTEIVGGWITVGGSIIPLGALAAIGALLSVTGVQSYFFHPRSLPIIWQNRAVALSYYTCAPIAPLGISLACWLAVIFTLARLPIDTVIRFGPIIDLLRLSSLGVAGLSALVFSFVNVRLLQRTTRCGVIRPMGMTITLLIVPAIVAGVALALPIIINFVRLVVHH
ncbi:MAG TPA: hypothetical protein VH370_09410 [Humisphaera sp.]|nr:hypothetical protein [Humisphaera sp.]